MFPPTYFLERPALEAGNKLEDSVSSTIHGTNMKQCSESYLLQGLLGHWSLCWFPGCPLHLRHDRIHHDQAQAGDQSDQ